MAEVNLSISKSLQMYSLSQLTIQERKEKRTWKIPINILSSLLTIIIQMINPTPVRVEIDQPLFPIFNF